MALIESRFVCTFCALVLKDEVAGRRSSAAYSGRPDLKLWLRTKFRECNFPDSPWSAQHRDPSGTVRREPQPFLVALFPSAPNPEPGLVLALG